jgi:hypothetical protein
MAKNADEQKNDFSQFLSAIEDKEPRIRVKETCWNDALFKQIKVLMEASLKEPSNERSNEIYFFV